MKIPRSAYNILGIPQYYADISYEHTRLVPTKQLAMQESMARAPAQGVLLVSGCAAPIVNQMFDLDRKVVGLSFSELFDSRFNSESNDTYPNSPVVLIHSIGLESAKDKSYSATILNSMLSFYKARETLVLLETPLTPSNFQTTYGITIKNVVTIGLKEEEAWV